MSDSATPGTAAHQAPLSVGFPRREYWSGLPFPSPEGLPNLRDWICILCSDKQSLYHWATWEAHFIYSSVYIGEGNGTPLQYFCLENPMDGGAWLAAVHGVAQSRTRLSNFTFTFHFHALEKEMATHSSVLAWRILGVAEPGGLPSMGSHRVGHDWRDLAAAAAAVCIC